MQRVLIAWLATIGLVACDSGTTYRYASYREIQADVSVTAASVPEFVPRSATEINGWFHVELGQQSVEFKFSPSDAKTMSASFLPVSPDKKVAIQSEFTRKSWNGQPSEGALEYFVRTDRGRLEYLAVDPSQSRAYFWSHPL